MTGDAESGSLYLAFKKALERRSEDAAESEEVIAAVKTALSFVNDHGADVEQALRKFTASGHLAGDDGGSQSLPASAFNDYYKWTMMPVIRAVQRATPDLLCTFSVNVRDVAYREALLDSARGGSDQQLFEMLRHSLESLAQRDFDRGLFERCLSDFPLPAWDAALLDAVCGASGSPRRLADRVKIDLEASQPELPESTAEVLVHVFIAPDNKLGGQERLYIEATGPWHRVTWLETSMMQAIYEPLLRHSRRQKLQQSLGAGSGEPDDAAWYPEWLAEAFVRCVRSVRSAVDSGLRGLLMTGRRTGGLPLMLLQAMYLQGRMRSKDGVCKCLGTSSVTAHYWLKDAGVSADLIGPPGGTHAHELQMVVGALLSGVDDKACMPVSALVAHALYFHLSRPGGDVQDPARKGLMVMLTDTIGSPAFMKTAALLKITEGPHKGEPFLSIVGNARQDSGELSAFSKLMGEYGYKGGMMASEVEVPDDLIKARDSGFAVFGAGGFMGDSAKAWNAEAKNISMAAKVLRVYRGGTPTPVGPVKTGDACAGSSGEGKFEADGLLSVEQLDALRARTKRLAAADLNPEVGEDGLQKLFEAELSRIMSA